MISLSKYNPADYSENQYNTDKLVVKYSLFVSCSVIVILWLIKLIEVEYNIDFSNWGILPLSWKGIRGIIFAPLIHSNFEHLAANTLPLLILTFSLFFFYRKIPWIIFSLIYILSGAFVWLAGREAIHIGASGIIYGLAAFQFLGGILSNNVRLLTISLIVALIYGYMFWGIFPIRPDISWESHLWGGVTGFGLALLFGKSVHYPQLNNTGQDENDYPDENEEEPSGEEKM